VDANIVIAIVIVLVSSYICVESEVDKLCEFNQSSEEWQISVWWLISAQINVQNRRNFSLQHLVHSIKLFTSAHTHTHMLK